MIIFIDETTWRVTQAPPHTYEFQPLSSSDKTRMAIEFQGEELQLRRYIPKTKDIWISISGHGPDLLGPYESVYQALAVLRVLSKEALVKLYEEKTNVPEHS
jgi:hypothetical protein